MAFRECPLLADIVAKSFFGCSTKILRTADALRARRREGPHRFTQNRPRSFVAALQNVTAEEKSKNQLSRDFWCCPILDFCNSICQEPTSLQSSSDTCQVPSRP